MADVELIIKLPEEVYQKIKETSRFISGKRSGKSFDYTLFNAIYNGTPLNKIRTEISKQSRMHMDGDLYIKVSECMQIIDKHSEGGV